MQIKELIKKGKDYKNNKLDLLFTYILLYWTIGEYTLI